MQERGNVFSRKISKISRNARNVEMMSRLICVASVLAVAVTVKSTLPTENLFFYETFDEVDPFSSGKWVKSTNDKYADQPVMVKTLSQPVAGRNELHKL